MKTGRLVLHKCGQTPVNLHALFFLPFCRIASAPPGAEELPVRPCSGWINHSRCSARADQTSAVIISGPRLALIGCLVIERFSGALLSVSPIFVVDEWDWGLLRGCQYWTRSARVDWLIPWGNVGHWCLFLVLPGDGGPGVMSWWFQISVIHRFQVFFSQKPCKYDLFLLFTSAVELTNHRRVFKVQYLLLI